MKWFFESKISFFELIFIWINIYLLNNEIINWIVATLMLILGSLLSIIGKKMTGVEE